MTKTGTQNRPYTSDQLMVNAVFKPADPEGQSTCMAFDWNDRDSVRHFAAKSDAHIRAGGSTVLSPIHY